MLYSLDTWGLQFWTYPNENIIAYLIVCTIAAHVLVKFINHPLDMRMLKGKQGVVPAMCGALFVGFFGHLYGLHISYGIALSLWFTVALITSYIAIDHCFPVIWRIIRVIWDTLGKEPVTSNEE